MLSPVAHPDQPPCGRLAPSPTGLLHLGNAWAFLLAWLAARVEGGRVLLRVEDIDPARSKAPWAEALVEDLLWLGLDWDEGSVPGGGERGPCGPYVQSRRGALYQAALDRLTAQGLVYPCYCTRKELRQMASAPQTTGAETIPYAHLQSWVGDQGALYPGTCRTLTPDQRRDKERHGRRPALRLACPASAVERGLFGDMPLDLAFFDHLHGSRQGDLAACGGDFALRRSDGVWAYHLAVVVDDLLMGVNQVVRGEDIFVSTPRQVLLFRLLNGTVPKYAHIPLLHDSAGERLAKRHGSLSLRALRGLGVRPQTIVGWLARQAGFSLEESLSPTELVGRLRREGDTFPWQKLPCSPLVVPDELPRQLLG